MAEVGSLAEKFGKILQENSEVELLPPAIRRRVQALQKLQSKKDELDEEFEKEFQALEAKYEALFKPLYAERSDIVTGKVEPPAPEGSTTSEEGDDSKGVPEFWARAMSNNSLLGAMIKEQDEAALKHLIDIKASNLEGDAKGFLLEFTFTENEFFENTLLTKKYIMADEENDVLDHAEGTEIKWKEGKNLTVKLVKKKQKSKHGKKRELTKEEACESFFNFFSPPQVPDQEALENMDEMEQEELQTVMSTDYEMGIVLKEKIIPDAVRWYTGEAAEDDDDEGFDFDEFDDEEEEDEDDEDEAPAKGHKHGKNCKHPKGRKASGDDDEDDDEEDAAPAPKGGKGKGGKGGAAPAPGQNPAECKQQ